MRLIDAEKLCELARSHTTKSVDCNDIMRFPTVNVHGYGAAPETVINAPTAEKCEGERGRWVAVSRRTMSGWNLDFPGRDPTVSYVCSACGTEAIFNRNGEGVLSKYCPHCGAKMWNEEDI